MLARVEGTQSGGAVYRRVVLRNVICTVGIVTFYAITTVVVYLALLRESLANDKVRHEVDSWHLLGSLAVHNPLTRVGPTNVGPTLATAFLPMVLVRIV